MTAERAPRVAPGLTAEAISGAPGAPTRIIPGVAARTANRPAASRRKASSRAAAVVEDVVVPSAPPGYDPAAAMGAEIRRLRRTRGISLRKLAAMTGLSPGFLSLVERGHSSLGISSMLLVANALGTYITRLLPPPEVVDEAYREPFITRADGPARASFDLGPLRYRAVSSPWPGRGVEPVIIDVPAGYRPADPPYGHEGEEFAYVIEGEVIFHVDGTDHVLRAGDSIHLQSGVPHEMRNPGLPARILFVTSSHLF
jgi:transcriptional regulator with XRE-family HTH domain